MPNEMKRSHSLLIEKDDFILLYPDLAVAIGLNEAIVLQRIQFWLNDSDDRKLINGHRWVYNTIEQWQKQFPFWSVDTIARTLKSLRDQGLLIAEQLHEHKAVRTLFYRINRERVDQLARWSDDDSEAMPAECQDQAGSDTKADEPAGILPAWKDAECSAPCPQNASFSIKAKNSTKNNQRTHPKSDSETPKKGRPVKQSDNEAFNIFWAVYPRKDAKTQARTAFEKKIKTPEMAEQVIEAVKQRRGIWSTDLKFIPLASTWLNNERWNEEAKTPTPIPRAPSRAPMSSADAQRMIDTGDLNGFELA